MTDALDWTGSRLGALQDLERGRRLDPEALRRAVAARADALGAQGLAPGLLLAVARAAPVDTLVDLLAGWRLGAAVAMLDAGLTAPERETVLAHARPRLLAGDEGDTLPETEPRRFDGPVQDRPALLLFTSGTTGDPKAVVLSMRALQARVALNIAEIGAPTLATTLQTLPLHFGHGLIGSALTTLAAGGTVLFPDRTGLTLARGVGALIDSQQVTFLTSVPTFWRSALRLSPPPQGDSLKRVHVGSAPLSAALWGQIADWCGAPVWNCYGITETANWIGGAPWPGPQAATDAHVGRPWGGSYAIRGATGPQAEGEGEVLYRGPALMSGYLDRAQATAAALSGGWYATGDTGRLVAGALTLSGRRKEEINRAGIKVQPADVDRVVEAHASVAECCCFGAPDPIAGETVAAAIVAEPGAQIDPQVLRDHCAARLRPHAIPEKWFPVAAIPRTPRGKVSRAAVAKALL